MSLTTYALLFRVFSKCLQENNNVMTLWTNFSRHTSLTYLKVVLYTDLLPILLYAKNGVFDIYTFGYIMFPVTHTFWELRLSMVRIRGVAPLEYFWKWISGKHSCLLSKCICFIQIIKDWKTTIKMDFFKVSSHLKEIVVKGFKY